MTHIIQVLGIIFLGIPTVGSLLIVAVFMVADMILKARANMTSRRAPLAEVIDIRKLVR